MSTLDSSTRETAVLHTGGLHYASKKSVVERALSARPGVISVEANPVAQTATVVFDAGNTSIADLQAWVEECGFHCEGRSVPGHVCDPMAEVAETDHGHESHMRA